LGNKDKENEYLLEYFKIHENLLKAERIAVELPLNEMSRKGSENYWFSEKISFYFVLVISMVIGMFLLLFVQRWFGKNMSNVIESLNLHDYNELQNEEDSIEVAPKINYTFDEVFQLAKTNSPCFLTLFKEAYPEFCKKLLKIQPGLISTELAFCAMLKLNFSTKDIAEYTFVTIRSVQTRKNRLRKRLEIPSNTDLYRWIADV